VEYVQEALASLSLILDWIIANSGKMLTVVGIISALLAALGWQTWGKRQERSAKERLVDAVAISPELAVKKIADSLNPDDPCTPPLSPTDILKIQKEAIKDHIAELGIKAIDRYVAGKKKEGENG
jgi:hypothetical protein